MDEKIISEMEIILSEYQLLNIRLANVIETLRQQQPVVRTFTETNNTFTDSQIQVAAENMLKKNDGQ
jgi:hypothetical protein